MAASAHKLHCEIISCSVLQICGFVNNDVLQNTSIVATLHSKQQLHYYADKILSVCLVVVPFSNRMNCRLILTRPPQYGSILLDKSLNGVVLLQRGEGSTKLDLISGKGYNLTYLYYVICRLLSHC